MAVEHEIALLDSGKILVTDMKNILGSIRECCWVSFQVIPEGSKTSVPYGDGPLLLEALIFAV